jgi:cytochrome c-type biogenesis protein CcmH
VACLFVLIPVLRMGKIETEDEEGTAVSREKENVTLFQERLAELELEKSDNRISDDVYQQRKQELEVALLNDVNENDISSKQPSASKPVLIYSVVTFSLLFVVGFSFWFYQENGAKDLVDQYNSMSFNAQELANAKELARQGDMSALLKQLYEKLQSAPDNIEGWDLLARSAMNVQNFSLANEAYLQIIRIYEAQDQNPAPIYGLLAQAKYYESEGELNSDVDAALKKALSLDENELNSLGLLAIDAFSNKRLDEAKEIWQKILTIYPEHPARTSIEAGIERANAELGITTERSTIPESSSTDSVSVVVTVSLDDSLKAKVKSSDTVFILAKQVDGTVSNPNIPLAASKHRVDELPLTITLDDSMSMAPSAKLSMAKTVVVAARISKSGKPTAQAGDFEAVSSDIKPIDNEHVALVIQAEVY